MQTATLLPVEGVKRSIKFGAAVFFEQVSLVSRPKKFFLADSESKRINPTKLQKVKLKPKTRQIISRILGIRKA
ncbi:hypothetical protein A3H55_01780 [Candidatus Kuenenbacteria bacterium RIFCSPLOWO2_02_FULL_42_16]|uniref:Uncharacterized protein n=1 Tax=Candidatus Kuenenbacteria bacterium RIFCSPLOWO2_02_FULL_42_16 TaxID=1798564 RepID=A0A1F6FWN4_9BACT|nr:MAG: hypothetical protein A3H55_01780 [Candidatus Kuenenbacteria bacterium RIFCSPLOWO2_02_FULL_42_16]